MSQISRMLVRAGFAIAMLGATGLVMPPAALAVGDGELGLPVHKPHVPTSKHPHKHRGPAVVHAGGPGKYAVATLATAIRKVRHGGTVVVHPGVNGHETLKIRKAVSIVTANDMQVQLFPDGARRCVDIDVPLHYRVEIFNLEFLAPPGGHRTVECIVSRGANLRLTNVVVEGGNLAPAIVVHGGYSLITKSLIYEGSSGLVLAAQPEGDHVLTETLIHGARGNALELDRDVSIMAVDNVIEYAGLAGILDGARSGLLARNTIRGNGAGVIREGLSGRGHHAGGRSWAVGSTTYSDNLILRNDAPGIDVRGASVRTSGNCLAFNYGGAVIGAGPGSPPDHAYGNHDGPWRHVDGRHWGHHDEVHTPSTAHRARSNYGRGDRDPRRGEHSHDVQQDRSYKAARPDDEDWVGKDDAARAFFAACGERMRQARQHGYRHEHKHTHDGRAPYRSHTHPHAH